MSSPGFAGTWVGDNSPFLTFGTSAAGIVIGFENCEVPPFEVLQTTYTLYGTSSPCAFLEVAAHPDYPQGLAFPNCYADFTPAIGGRLTINPDGTCPPLPVETSTWGRVKALYR